MFSHIRSHAERKKKKINQAPFSQNNFALSAATRTSGLPHPTTSTHTRARALAMINESGVVVGGEQMFLQMKVL